MRGRALLVGLLALLPALSGCLGGSLVGRPVPAFSLVTDAGEPVNASTFHGRYLILDLMATWCAPCRLEVGHLQDVRRAYGDRVVILSVGVDPQESPDDLDAFARERNVTWAHALDVDGHVAQAMGLRTIPKLVVVDPDGVVVLDQENEVLPQVISAAIDGRPVGGGDVIGPFGTAMAALGLGFLVAFNPYRKLHRQQQGERAEWAALALLALLAILAYPLSASLSGRATYGSLVFGVATMGAALWWLRARRQAPHTREASLLGETLERAYETGPAFALALVLALLGTGLLAFAAPLAGFLAGVAIAVVTREAVPAQARVPLGLAGLVLAGAGLLAFGARVLLAGGRL